MNKKGPFYYELIDFVNGYYDFVNNKCKFSMPIDNCECDYDGDCVQHYLEYYIEKRWDECLQEL